MVVGRDDLGIVVDGGMEPVRVVPVLGERKISGGAVDAGRGFRESAQNEKKRGNKRIRCRPDAQVKLA